MQAQIYFNVSIVFSFVAWGIVAGSVIWPELRRRGRAAPLPSNARGRIHDIRND